MAIATKSYIYKVYSSTGTYLGTWPSSDIVSDLTYSQEINSTGSEITIKLARNGLSFDEGHTVNFNNKVQIYCVDTDSPNGALLFQGFISSYTPVIEGGNEYVEVKLLGYGSTLSQIMLRHDPPLNTWFDDVEDLFYSSGLSGQPFGLTSWLAFSFVPDVSITGLTAMELNGGSQGQVQAAIYTDNNGVPGSIIGSFVTAGTQIIGGITNPSGTVYQVISTGGGTFAYVLPGDTSPITGNAPIYNSFITLNRFVFSSPYPTFVGDGNTRYWIVLKNPSAGTTTSDNVYTGGNGYAGLDATKFGFATSSNSGSTWSLDSASYSASTQMIGMRLWSTNAETTLTYTAIDPSLILQDVITKYNNAGGVVTYNNTIDLTGTAVSLTLNTNTPLDAINLILSSAPGGWYWYIDQATNLIHFHNKTTAANNTFILGRDISTFKPEKRLDDVVNVVYVTGQNIYKKYTNSVSLSLYGERMTSFVDSRITDIATAQQVGYAILENYSAPQTRLSFDIVDNNGNTSQGRNIEAIQVGQTVTFRAFESYASNLWGLGLWDTAHWDYDITQYGTYVLQITRIDYGPDKLSLTASTTPPDVTKQVDQIKKRLQDVQTVDNPPIPTP